MSKIPKDIKYESALIAKFVNTYITGLSNDELENLITFSSLANQTNCWWVEYELKDVIADIAQNTLDSRKLQNG